MLGLACLPPPLAPAPTATDSDASDDRIVRGELGARLDDHLERLSHLGFSGTVLVARKGDVILAGSYGFADRDDSVAMTPTTLIPIGSISKHFTAAAILRLEMDGKLRVEDTLDRFFADVPLEKRAITVHQLLCHSSGLPGGMGVGGGRDRDSFVRGALASGVMFPPGAEFEYSNMGYALLAAIIEVASGLPFEDYLRSAIFEPAGMTDTGIAHASWRPERSAHGYIDGNDVGTLADDGAPGWGLLGAGGLLSTIFDMYLWNEALDRASVLSEGAITKMTTAHSASMHGTYGYGYGCGINPTPHGTRRIGHNGSNDIFSADFRRYPDDEVFIYGAGNDASAYVFDITPTLERMVFGDTVEAPPEVMQLSGDELATYTGTWKLDDGGELRVETDGVSLKVGSEDALAAGLVFPVEPGQVARRVELMERLVGSYELALEGELRDLHQLLDPYAPFEEWAAMNRRMIESWKSRSGAPRAVHAIPGFNRFGEIGVIAVLELERGRVMVEYSFGEEEVGSIRFLGTVPMRVLHPLDAGTFVSYDVASGESWTVGFELDDRGRPSALILRDPAGESVKAHR